MLMSAVSSILSHVHSRKASPLDAQARTQAQTSALPQSGTAVHNAAASGTPPAASGSASSGAITANDFLTLLVTEIQNQDPTSQTDPMTYITQLVGVNSLQQLLQINQTLTTATGAGGALAPAGTTPPGTGQSRIGGVAAGNSVQANASLPGAQAVAASAAGASQFPVAANAPATEASTNAVAQAFAHPAIMPQQLAPPTPVPLNPEVLRALEHSIPGAKLTAPVSGAQ